MPLIVLLDDVFAHFTRAVKRLEHWNELVELEVLLVARGRSAFLIHWFGSLIPLDGSSVRIGIVNLEALRARYSLVTSKRRSRLSDGPSILEPAAGMAGSIAGALFAPEQFGAALVLGEPFIAKKLGSQVKKILLKIAVVVNWELFGAFGPIVFMLAAIFGPALIIGFAGVPGTAEMQDFLTAATRVAKPLAEFWTQASGPRDKVKNPIVRTGLDILDKLPVLFPFLMELVTFFILKIGPLLDPLLHQFQALGEYVNAVFELAKFAGKGLMDLVTSWLDPKASGSLPAHLRYVIARVMSLIDFLVIAINGLLIGNATDYFNAIGTGLASYFSAIGDWVKTQFKSLLDENPFIKAVRALKERIESLMPFFDRLSAPPKSSKPSKPDPDSIGQKIKDHFDMVSKDIDWIKANVPARDFDLDIDGLLAKHQLAPFPSIEPVMSPPEDPFAEVRTKFAKRPRSIFTGEWKALNQVAKDDFGFKTIAEAVAAAHIDETRLRDALLAVASKVLPPAMQPYLKTLSDSMELAEKHLGQKPVAENLRALPVLELSEDRKIRPVVGKLVIRVSGATRELAEEWTEGLKVTLRGQLYEMAAETGVGG